jgi:Lipocalin-like domain
MIRRNKTAWAAIIAIATIALSVTSHAQQAMTKDKLVGTWRLVSFKSTTGNQVSFPLGEHPGGLVGYTASRIWVMFTDLDRKSPISATLSDSEAVALMKSHVAYAGRYDADPTQTPDGIKIVIHVDSAANQAIVGTDRTFFGNRPITAALRARG